MIPTFSPGNTLPHSIITELNLDNRTLFLAIAVEDLELIAVEILKLIALLLFL